MSTRIRTFVELMDIQPGDEILEIGCGHGIAATLICSRMVGGSYLAIDRSPKMVETASRRNEAFVKSGVAEFKVADLEAVDLGTRTFDKVLAMRVRLFRAEPERAERIAKQWLRPNGQLFVQFDEPEDRRSTRRGPTGRSR